MSTRRTFQASKYPYSAMTAIAASENSAALRWVIIVSSFVPRFLSTRPRNILTISVSTRKELVIAMRTNSLMESANIISENLASSSNTPLASSRGKAIATAATAKYMPLHNFMRLVNAGRIFQ
jgi:hypothetical protein